MLRVVVCCCLLSQQANGFSGRSAPLPSRIRQFRASAKPTEGETRSSSAASPAADSDNLQLEDIDWKDLGTRIFEETMDVSSSLSLAATPLFQSDESVAAEDVVVVCDELDQLVGQADDDMVAKTSLAVKRRALKFKRYELLVKLMRQDYKAYVATASFLSPSRIPRLELPNVQDVPYDKAAETAVSKQVDENGAPLVSDCDLEAMEYKESILDKVLLSIFRKLVTKNTNGVASDEPGISGLLDQGRSFMLQPNQTPEAQHKMVSDTLGGLMTPVLPPFYRIFMSGIVPKLGTDYDGKQIGPWFYAPFLTSFVTPTFFGFLVGPSRPNRRKDGQLGGLVVEKCKFLQESGCKGLCLHQCKLPAQQFFQDELGLPLTVQPNFVTQECQWSFGEVPVPVAEDESFPKGCLAGCQSRKMVSAMNGPAYADLCS